MCSILEVRHVLDILHTRAGTSTVYEHSIYPAYTGQGGTQYGNKFLPQTDFNHVSHLIF